MNVVFLVVWAVLPITNCKVLDVLSVPRPPFKAEVDDQQYVVLMEKPGSRAEFDNAITMKDSDGKEYKCLLPGADDADTLSTTDANVLAERIFQERTPSKLLDAFGSLCFYRNEDWWTYEVCYKKHVRQFHKDQVADKLMSEYNLGKYSEKESVTDNIMVDTSLDSRYTKYVSQYYLDGETCDLTKHSRSTEVRYVCNPDVKDSIVSIKEDPSCQYTVYVATPRLCSHPEFKQKEAQASFIRCQGVVPGSVLRNEDDEQKVEEWVDRLEEPQVLEAEGSCGEGETCQTATSETKTGGAAPQTQEQAGSGSSSTHK